MRKNFNVEELFFRGRSGAKMEKKHNNNLSDSSMALKSIRESGSGKPQKPSDCGALA